MYQIKIGKDNLWGYNQDYYNFESKYCIPSVQNWAKKHNYDYKLYTEPTLDDFGYWDNLKNPNCIYSAEKITKLDNAEYDYLIYIDADVVVNNDEEKFPLNEGITMFWEYYFSEIDFKSIFGFEKNNYKHFNAGVFSVDLETSKKIKTFFYEELNNRTIKNPTYAEQDIINLWMMETEYKFVNELEEKWNYMLMPHNEQKLKENISKINFLHFAGTGKNKNNFSEYLRLKKHKTY